MTCSSSNCGLFDGPVSSLRSTSVVSIPSRLGAQNDAIKATAPKAMLARNTVWKESEYASLKLVDAISMIFAETPGTASTAAELPAEIAVISGSTDEAGSPAFNTAGTTMLLVLDVSRFDRIVE